MVNNGQSLHAKSGVSNMKTSMHNLLGYGQEKSHHRYSQSPVRKEYKPANISTNSNASIQQRDSSQTRSQVNISGNKPCSFTKFEESLKTMASSQNNSINNNDNKGSSNRHLSTNNYMKPNLGNGNLKDSS
jgi:hypothetical protein